MRKILALLVTFAMLLTPMAAFAAPIDDLFTALDKDMLSGNLSGELTAKLNKPMKFLATIDPEAMDMFDFQSLAESSFDTTVKMNMQYNMSKDYKKMQAYMNLEFNVPLKIQDTFKTTTWARCEYWLDMDLSDAAKPVYKITYKTPFSKKYIYYDMSDQISQMGLTGFYNNLYNEETMKSIRQQIFASIRKNSAFSYANGTYTLKINDTGAKAFLKDMFGVIKGMFKSEFGDVESETVNPINNIIDFDGISNSIDALKDVKLFGENGLTYQYKLKDGYLSEANITADIDTNIYDIAKALGDSTEGMERDNYDLSFETHENDVYSDTNKPQTIAYPKLTPDNSVNINDKIKKQQEKYKDFDYNSIRTTDYFFVSTDELPVIENGKVYVPLRPLMGEYMIRDENIAWDNGSIVVTSDDKFSDFGYIKLSSCSNDVEKDGTVIHLTNPVIERNDTTYVSDEFINYVLNSNIDYFNIGNYGEGYYGSYHISRPNPDYVAKNKEGL